MKERQIKINLIVNSITIVLLATILFICTAFAWYVTNKTVSANGIFGASAKGNLAVTNHSVFDAIINEDGTVDLPELPSDPKEKVEGVLEGSLVYYGVELKSSNDILKDITIQLAGVDGGEWFTEPPVLTDETDYNNYYNSGNWISSYGNASKTNEVYKYTYPEISVDTNGVTSVVYKDVTVPLYTETTGKEFYFSYIDGKYYRNYIYVNAYGNKCNMTDIYTIKIHTIKLYELTDDGDINIHNYYNLDTIPTGGVDMDLLLDTSNVSHSESCTYKHLIASELEKRPLTNSAHDKRVEKIELMKFRNWDPKNDHMIVFIFEIGFELPGYMTDDVDNKKLSMNSMSRKTLSIDGMVIIGEDKEVASTEVTS